MSAAHPTPPTPAAAPARSAREEASHRVAHLHPAYFALAMSTGVISIASHLLKIPWVPQALLWLNLPIYAILWGLTLVRAVRFGRQFLADWRDHQRGVGFFTTVAATGVLGVQLVVVRGATEPAFVLWWIALGLWALCMYGIFTSLITREQKPSLADGINGGWLVAVVATQSLCVLGCQISPAFGENRAGALYLMLALWLCGGMLYIWTISLIFYRYTFFRFQPSDLMPPYWINMGAMAISTLAGAQLIKNSAASPLLTSMLPFLKGFTVWYWATATWWIPMLGILAFWRHVLKRFPLKYDPLYWGAVFPLGMYTTSTFQMWNALDVPFLSFLPKGFIWIALTAWTLAFLGLLGRLSELVVLAVRRAEPVRRPVPERVES